MCSSRKLLPASLVVALVAALLLGLAPVATGDDGGRAKPAGARARSIVLDNGLEVIVIEKSTVPLVTIDVVVRTGAFTETETTDGLAHLYEHMFFKGNAALPSQEAYMRRVNELGITFNGTTSSEKVDYFITLPSKNFAAGMKFMSDALLSPLYNADELDSERHVVTGEYDRNEADPNYHLRTAVGRALYPGTYHRKNALGERKVILSATRDHMLDFRAKYYVPNNSALIICGDVNRTEAVDLARALFGEHAWPEGSDPHREKRTPHAPLVASKYLIVEKATQSASIDCVWRGPDIGKDDRATIVADVFGTLLALPTSKLSVALRDTGLATGAGMSYYTQRENGEIHFGARVNGDNVNQTIEAAFVEIERMATDPTYFTADDVAVAAANLQNDWLYAGEQGLQLARDLGFWWAVADLGYYRDYLDEARTVTADEVRAFVRRYVLGKPHILGVLCNAETKARLELTPESIERRVAAITRRAGPEAAVTSYRLGNGLRVLVRRDPGSPTSALSVLFDGGARNVDEGREGIERLTAALMLAGSERWKRDELRERMARLGARFSTASDYDVTHTTVKSTRGAFAEAVKTLASCLREPQLDGAELVRIRDAIVNDLKAEQEDPNRKLWRNVNDGFFAGHPYLRYPSGTLEAVPGLGEKEVRAHRDRILRADRMLVVVVGDHEPEPLRALLDAELGDLPRGDGAPLAALPEFAADGPLINWTEREIPTTYFAGKFPIPAIGAEGWAAARVAFTLLSKRFWDSIRTRHALSYAPFAGASSYQSNYGYVYVTTVDPDRCAQIMLEDARWLAATNHQQTQIDAIASQEFTRLFQGAEKPDVHALGLGRAELCYGGYGQFYDQADELRAVTPEQLRAAARTLFRGLRFGAVGPEAMDEAGLRALAAGPRAGR